MTDVLGLVLAGGRSRRFGADKASALLAGRSLLDWSAGVLAPHCREVAVSGAAKDGMRTLADPAGATPGPLAGVLAGLEWAAADRADWLATVPCDAPLLPDDLVVRLVGEAEAAGAPVAFAVTADGPQPLCAVWRPALAERLRVALAHGHPPIHAFAAEAGAARVAFADASAFLNINTPDDLARAEALLKRGS